MAEYFSDAKLCSEKVLNQQRRRNKNQTASLLYNNSFVYVFKPLEKEKIGNADARKVFLILYVTDDSQSVNISFKNGTKDLRKNNRVLTEVKRSIQQT